MRILIPLIFLLLCICAFNCTSAKKQEKPFASEIIWDTWGIPHIYGNSEKDLYKMMGWAQMRNHGDLIMKLYGEARGKSSKYWNGDIKRDLLLHKLGIIESSKNSYNSLSDANKEMVDSFTEGMNAYANKFPGSLNEEYKIVLPLQPEDVMAHTFRVFYYEFLINKTVNKEQKWLLGSNAWAIHKSKSANGNSMLLANPHLPWEDFWMFFEAQLITSENDLYGAALVGLPTIAIGFNKNLGWTHTINPLDNVDFYKLKVKNGQYELDSELKDFIIDSLRVTISKNDSKIDTLLVRKRSDFGVVLKEGNDSTIAIRWPNMNGNLDILDQWKAMGEAQSLKEFKSALAINSLPLFNVIYSDKSGNIMYHFGGNIPIKNGDWGKWQSIVASTSSKDIWDKYYSISQVPSYVNPETNWIHNANDPPFTSTLPSVVIPSKYPSHITAPNEMSFRAQRSAYLIKNANNLTLDEFIALKHDTKSEVALRLQDDFSKIASETTDSLTLSAIKILTEWDGAFDEKNQGAFFFYNLIKNFNMQDFADEWAFDKPLITPDGFKDPGKILRGIKIIAQSQISTSGSLKLEYGEIFKVKVGEYEYGANGGFDFLGIFRTLNFKQGFEKKYYGSEGDSCVCAIEFGDEVHAKALLAYGNATQKGNPHVGDQLKLYADKKLREVWLSRKLQEENLELVEKISDM
jgi:acyl-homoserine-lactone acylase